MKATPLQAPPPIVWKRSNSKKENTVTQVQRWDFILNTEAELPEKKLTTWQFKKPLFQKEQLGRPGHGGVCLALGRHATETKLLHVGLLRSGAGD